MPEFLLTLIRSIGAFILLLFMARVMGKKQLSQVTFFDYCVGITIGSIAASMSVDQNIKISNGLMALIIWGLFPIILAFAGLKSKTFLRLTDGKPSIVIENGEVKERNLKKNQMAIDELMLLLREKNIFKLSDIEMAVLETNGQLSVMKKTEQQSVTPTTLGMTVDREHGPTIVIMDGTLLEKGLLALGYSKEWLLGEIKKYGALDFGDVFLAQIDSKGNVYVDLYDEKTTTPVIHKGSLLVDALEKVYADLESYSKQTNNSGAREQAVSLQNTILNMIPYIK
ncbi:DUF421 domain-containing protein [Tuberibacillus sp. Marseille-P3662]|uniref:DUF421 domain-containing protein n=1 Tax=Tuberibacillus sp. Marseille-P3662 TaxID=1965358 RepID=UPI000A1CABCC|nr:DUF421 domain-containing protein [Tuberibacillus sp. Marseille-P3662]